MTHYVNQCSTKDFFGSAFLGFYPTSQELDFGSLGRPTKFCIKSTITFVQEFLIVLFAGDQSGQATANMSKSDKLMRKEKTNTYTL